jgi:hypothetical protein
MTTLSGRVTLPDNQPARTAVVELHNATGDVVDQVQVDDNGVYRYHVSAADWRVRAWDAHGHAARAETTVAEGEDKKLDIELTTEGA